MFRKFMTRYSVRRRRPQRTEKNVERLIARREACAVGDMRSDTMSKSPHAPCETRPVLQPIEQLLVAPYPHKMAIFLDNVPSLGVQQFDMYARVLIRSGGAETL
jgi:hypothetical protein